MPRFNTSPPHRVALALGVCLLAGFTFSGFAQEKPTTSLKEEMRVPWTRDEARYIRFWYFLNDPSFSGAFESDPFAASGGEAALKADGKPVKLPNGSSIPWRTTAWGDVLDFTDGKGVKPGVFVYGSATVTRREAGKALLCTGSDGSMRVWINGTLAIDHRGPRAFAFDEDRVEVDLKAGENTILVKVEHRPWGFSARILERGSIPPRNEEIGPSFTLESPTALVAKTDITREHAAEAPVTVEVAAPGGKILATATAVRGESVRFDPSGWPDGPYDIRYITRTLEGRLSARHRPWYKGNATAAARDLVAAAQKAEASTPAGQTLKMLADMVLDRTENFTATDDRWWSLHSPLMEYAELKLESAGEKNARARAYGFYRLAWRDDIDDSPQFARVYLPPGYDPEKKWPVVVKLHGFNPTNPVYIRWWSVDTRHPHVDLEYGSRGKFEGVIYIEPHGRANTQYLGLGDADIVRVLRLAKQQFSIDDDRVYLTGDSMGGWGTWNVGTRHPDLFAALAPVYGGADYRSQLTNEALAALTPLDRFAHEKQSSWSMADSLLNVPILVHHGDVDKSVPVDFSRYGVRLLQRWGYNIRYVEMPGYGHEELGRLQDIIDWCLQYRRDANPRHVRVRSAELKNASAYWIAVKQFDVPNQFMVVDAEVVGANTIRIDTQNILALDVTPAAALVDPAKPLKVVWNGEPQNVALSGGRIELRAANYQPAALAKNAHVAGPLGDIFNTPFAVVTGTASDPAMNQVCAEKSAVLAGFWQDWQKQPLRLFKDSEITDEDLARYSLLLVGGPEANLITRKLAAQLPLEIASDHVALGGRSFPATDARVQMIFPNPLNAQRYVVIAAASSAASLQFWTPRMIQNASFDFVIEDGHVPDTGQNVSPNDLFVASGWFNRDWQIDDALVVAGNAEQRAKSLVLRGPLEPKDADTYVGSYELSPVTLVKIARNDSQLTATIGSQPSLQVIPAGKDKFYLPEARFVITIVRNEADKITGFKFKPGPGPEIFGRKID